jgi:hypothetical protein
MNTDDLNDHPDLANLQLSKREQRKAQAEARRRQRQAFGLPPEPSFVRRHRTVIVAVVALAVVVVVGAVLLDGSRPGVTESAPSTTNTVRDRSPGVDLSQPFAGTPAAGWADGEAGIVAPAAAPVGSYTAEQVAAAYERVRQVLITARLDRAVLEGHDFERYLSLLAPNARTDMSQPSEDNYLSATRIADGFRLLPVAPKATGSMSAEEDPDGALLIRTDYAFAYAFEPEDPDEITGPMDIVAVDRFEAEYIIYDERWEELDQGLWLGAVQSNSYSMACEASKRGELAPSYSERVPDNGEDIPDEAEMFDPKAPMPTTSNCPG